MLIADIVEIASFLIGIEYVAYCSNIEGRVKLWTKYMWASILAYLAKLLLWAWWIVFNVHHRGLIIKLFATLAQKIYSLIVYNVEFWTERSCLIVNFDNLLKCNDPQNIWVRFHFPESIIILGFYFENLLMHS